MFDTDWSDSGLKCLITLSCLLREKGRRKLHKAIKKHVGAEDMDVSEAMETFLAEYPLSEAELATFEAVAPYEDWPDDLSMRLAPQFDGESEPFLIRCWDDLDFLPNVRQVKCQREGAIPPPELVARLPKLQSLVIDAGGELGKRNRNLFPKYRACGFFVSDVDYKTGWATLKRTKSGAPKEVFAMMLKRFPKEAYRKGKGGYRIDLARLSIRSGALVAHVELTLFRPEDPFVYTIGGVHGGARSDLPLLDANELAGENVAQVLEQRIDELFAHVAAERRLPAGRA